MTNSPAIDVLSLTLACIGRMKSGAERTLAAHYVERAILTARQLGFAVTLHEAPESKARRAADRKADEAKSLRAALPAGATLVVFDEGGRAVTSAELAELLQKAREAGVGLGLIVGGADGVDPALRDEAKHVIALGKMTWPHQLARIMVAEQIYRAATILAGHPYHRA